MELSQGHICEHCCEILHVIGGDFVEGSDSDFRCNGCLNKKGTTAISVASGKDVDGSA